MPRPAAGDPPKKDFQVLLQRLSLEFERLEEENGTMARELSKLGKEVHFQAGNIGGAAEYDSERLRVLTEGRREGGRGPTPPQPLSFAEKTSGVLEAAQLSHAHALTARNGSWCHTGSLASSEVQLMQSAQSVRSAWRSERDKASPTSAASKAAVLQDAFQALDESGSGKLSVEDLVRLLGKYREPVDYGSLVNVVRVLNDQDPLEMQTVNESEQDDVARGEGTCIDLAAFVRIMDISPASQAHLGPNVESSLKSLQRVLCREAQPKSLAAGQTMTAASGHSMGRDMSAGYPNLTRPEKSGYFKDKSGRTSMFWLEVLPTSVIILNVIVTGLSIDHSDYAHVWDVCEFLFGAFYMLEWVTKVWIFGFSGFFCGPDRTWNWFDFLCLQVSTVDIVVGLAPWLVTSSGATPDTLKGLLLTKVFRLARLARLVRTLRFKIFYELKLMVMGIMSGVRCLSWALALLVFLAYPMGVGLRALLGDELREFDTVPNSVFTLFRCWTDGCSALDGTPLQEKLYRDHGFLFLVFHLFMTMFVTVGLFNLIMAIFIDNVLNTQAQKKEREMAERSSEIEVRFKRLFTSFLSHGAATPRRSSLIIRVRDVCKNIASGEANFAKDASRVVSLEWSRLRSMNPRITKDLFEEWLEHDDFKQLLEDADIDLISHTELFDVLDADMGGELSLDELVTGLMKLRGPVSKADIVACRLKVGYLMYLMESYLPHSPTPKLQHANLTKTGTAALTAWSSTRSARRAFNAAQQANKSWEPADTVQTVHVRQGRC